MTDTVVSEPAFSQTARLEIGADEYRLRRERVFRLLQERQLDAVCVFGPTRVAYLSGFFFSPTERPIALILTADGRVAALLPQLELSHFQQQGPALDDSAIYPEYPGGGSGRHPLLFLRELLSRLGVLGRRIAADVDGYEHRWGYRGPALGAVLEQPVQADVALIDNLRMVKSATEIALMTEACRWGDHAHRLMQNSLGVGAEELLVSHGASLQATRDLLAALGERYVPKAREGLPANAMFIRGSNTAHPHGLHEAGAVKAGDVLVTGAYGVVGGYESELERTMIVGEPDARFQRYFAAMLAAQQVGLDALRPGRTCAEVEADVRRFIRVELGMDDLVRHHTGHAFGLEGHEHPFLDLDDHTVIEPGMVFSVEPGLYVPQFAGFRHSDTVVITSSGSERLSLYPRELDELVVPVG
ncbi:M24 family metallopeptidase [Deinococcus humi]|uniref:Xaa-Pro aminopeptidase n=1 Tax=Deinococcus humi TaxID=662880 RepID=A0A7W8ND80_9DEIO|nr:Xaa-Pro peptidase family protein [Deinococcus humi]MBB5362969.1 Xaa-Pro aminopeptidase [Deinococcus humi]GGO25367.1 peptidase M24 [Deinococcus humi]